MAGWLGKVPEGKQVAERMLSRLRHRGPEALRQWPEATLAHARLDGAEAQAAKAGLVSNETGTVWCLMDGHLYNRHLLRRELEKRGHRFRSPGATEVVVHLYEEEGEAAFAQLRGAFALVLYDASTKTLLLARDRFGTKPLYYAPTRQVLAFGSGLDALREVPSIDLRPNRQAIYDFAALLKIPAPQTFYRGLRALQPAEMLTATWHRDEVSWHTKRYHRFTIAPDPRLTLETAAERAEELLENAVRRRMEHTTPVGVFLSGGLDSSLISAAAQRYAEGDLYTFNVRFPDSRYDETWAAQAVASHLGSRHMTVDIKQRQGTWASVTGTLRQVGQPFADTSLFAADALCRAVREHVGVALAGDAGDAVMGAASLRHLRPALYAMRLPGGFWSVTERLLRLAAGWRVADKGRRVAGRLKRLTRADDTAIVQDFFSWIRQEEWSRLCRPAEVEDVRRHFEPAWEYHFSGKASRLERLAARVTEVDIRHVVPEDYLVKNDVASRRHHLDIHFPMLDEDLVAFGLTLPYNLKATTKTNKPVLRSLAASSLPIGVARKAKRGFALPVDVWVDADFKAQLRATLLHNASGLDAYFRPEVYQPWIEAFCQGTYFPGISREGLYQRVIMLLSVHLALEQTVC